MYQRRSWVAAWIAARTLGGAIGHRFDSSLPSEVEQQSDSWNKSMPRFIMFACARTAARIQRHANKESIWQDPKVRRQTNLRVLIYCFALSVRTRALLAHSARVLMFIIRFLCVRACVYVCVFYCEYRHAVLDLCNHANPCCVRREKRNTQASLCTVYGPTTTICACVRV